MDLLILVEGVDKCVPDLLFLSCNDLTIIRPVSVVLAVIALIGVHYVELAGHLALFTDSPQITQTHVKIIKGCYKNYYLSY